MSEHEQISQLSALYDGELPSGQADLVIRRALRDPATVDRWSRYALIGACVRDEPLASASGISVADRVSARLLAEPALNAAEFPADALASAPPRVRYGLFGRASLGGAIAAGVALVSIFVVRSMAPVAADAGALTAAVAEQDSAPGYTTPIDLSPVPVRVDRSLASYMVAHGEVPSSAYRLSSLSAVMYDGYDPTVGAVEMTEAEIGAQR